MKLSQRAERRGRVREEFPASTVRRVTRDKGGVYLHSSIMLHSRLRHRPHTCSPIQYTSLTLGMYHAHPYYHSCTIQTGVATQLGADVNSDT